MTPIHFLIASIYELGTRAVYAGIPSWTVVEIYPFTKTPRLYLLVIKVLMLLMQIESTMPLKMRDMVTQRRLKRLLRNTSKIPWWAARIAGEEKLLQIKPVEKRDLAGIPREALMSSKISDTRMSWRKTSGTSGEPFVWGIDNATVLREINTHFFQTCLYYGGVIGTTSQPSVIAINFPHAFEVPVFGMVRKDVTFKGEPLNNEREKLQEIITEIEKSHPKRMLYGYPSELLSFVQALKRNGLTLSAPLVLTTGQVLEPQIRMAIKEVLGAAVYGVYSSRETALIGFECKSTLDTYHVCEGRMLLEIVDESGNSVIGGEEGRIVITPLDQQEMPLIRYAIGDRGTFTNDNDLCKCGLTLRRFTFTGRTSDFLQLKTGEKIPVRRIRSLLLEPAFFRHIKRARVVQSAETTLTIEIDLMSDVAMPQTIEKNLISKISMIVKGQLKVHVRYVDLGKVPGKFKDYIPYHSSQDLQEIKRVS